METQALQYQAKTNEEGGSILLDQDGNTVIDFGWRSGSASRVVEALNAGDPIFVYSFSREAIGSQVIGLFYKHGYTLVSHAMARGDEGLWNTVILHKQTPVILGYGNAYRMGH